MKIQYCSDLHLEFPENKRFIEENPLVPSGEILLLAGDILPFAWLDKKWDFFNFVSDYFEKVFWIPGNHEYYHTDISERSGELFEKIRNNVFLVNNYQEKINDVHFYFSTLWGNIGPQHQWTIQQGVSDFYRIKKDGRRFTAEDFNEQHLQSRLFLKNALDNSDSVKNIVVTHHVPTKINYPDEYINSPINEAFVVEMGDFIENSKADYWVYGHHHRNVEDFKIGQTTLVTNQLGYLQRNENQLFINNKYINI